MSTEKSPCYVKTECNKHSALCRASQTANGCMYMYIYSKRKALFTVNFSHLHNNVFKRGCEAISGRNTKIARNCLTSTFKNIVMQMRKVNCEKGYRTLFNQRTRAGNRGDKQRPMNEKSSAEVGFNYIISNMRMWTNLCRIMLPYFWPKCLLIKNLLNPAALDITSLQGKKQSDSLIPRAR